MTPLEHRVTFQALLYRIGTLGQEVARASSNGDQAHLRASQALLAAATSALCKLGPPAWELAVAEELAASRGPDIQ
jgi:hypothetical protein